MRAFIEIEDVSFRRVQRFAKRRQIVPTPVKSTRRPPITGRLRSVFSVLIGRVSTEDSRRIVETLDALRAQERSLPYEVIIADRGSMR